MANPLLNRSHTCLGSAQVAKGERLAAKGQGLLFGAVRAIGQGGCGAMRPAADLSQDHSCSLPADIRLNMPKEEIIRIEGEITEILPDGRFRVKLENEHEIIAYTAGKMRKNRIRSIVGDRVHVEMTPYDLDKGRIVFREKTTPMPMNQRRFFRR
jgi:translation initiation factor IF-1